MSGVTCNPAGFAHEAGVVNVQKENRTNDLLSFSHRVLQSRAAGTVPQGDAAGQDFSRHRHQQIQTDIL